MREIPWSTVPRHRTGRGVSVNFIIGRDQAELENDNEIQRPPTLFASGDLRFALYPDCGDDYVGFSAYDLRAPLTLRRSERGEEYVVCAPFDIGFVRPARILVQTGVRVGRPLSVADRARLLRYFAERIGIAL